MATFNHTHHAKLMSNKKWILAGLVADRKIETGSDLLARQNATPESAAHFEKVRNFYKTQRGQTMRNMNVNAGYGDEITWGGAMPYPSYDEDARDEAIENRLDEEFAENYIEHIFSEDFSKFEQLLLKIVTNKSTAEDVELFKNEAVNLYDQAFKKFSKTNWSKAHRDLINEYEEYRADCILLD
jgi:hypothetical protein